MHSRVNASFFSFQDTYETFNILIRRKPKENNFKVSQPSQFRVVDSMAYMTLEVPLISMKTVCVSGDDGSEHLVFDVTSVGQRTMY